MFIINTKNAIMDSLGYYGGLKLSSANLLQLNYPALPGDIYSSFSISLPFLTVCHLLLLNVES